MRFGIRRPLWMGAAILLGMGLMVRLGIDGVAWSHRLDAERDRLRTKLSRLQGWAAVAPEVATQIDVVFGKDRISPTAILEDLSRQARATGARVTELKPLAGELEIGLEGAAAPLGAYLQEIAAHRPPLQVESVSLVSQPKDSAPLLMRLRVRPILPAEPRP